MLFRSDEIERISEFGFLFKTDQLDLNRKYTLDIKKTDIENLLKEVLNLDEYTYTLIDRNIVITRIDSKTQQDNNSKKVTGKITDSSGIGMPGVTVVIKGTNTGTITDANGNYLITNIPENATLQFSFVGMKGQEISVGNQTTINVEMEVDAIGIEEVVAVGYGTRLKGELTGSVSKVGDQIFQSRPLTNSMNALQGAMPGVTVTRSSGQPGREGYSFQIRGVSSISGSRDRKSVV